MYRPADIPAVQLLKLGSEHELSNRFLYGTARNGRKW
jgi:hypothetical protein